MVDPNDDNAADFASVPDSSERGSAPSRAMFWVLMALASSAFVPCVLAPIWQDYRAMKLAHAREAAAVRDMQGVVARQRRHVDALRTDPMVNERIARRDLRYSASGETIVRVDASLGSPGPRSQRALALPPGRVDLPEQVAKWLRWIPFPVRIDTFCDRNTQATLISLAGVLMTAAFLLYPPRRLRRPAPDVVAGESD